MKALFKHLSVITQGKLALVANETSLPNQNILSPFLSTTLLAVLLGVPQVPIMGGGKVMAQAAASCPAGTAPETVQFQASDSLQDLTEQYSIGGINTVLTLTEEVPGQVIDRTESRFDGGIYGGLQGPNLRLNIGPGKPNAQGEPGGTGNLAPGSATLTITFGQPVTLASPLTFLDVDRNGERDVGRVYQDRVTVGATNNNSNVPVSLQSLGPFTEISGNTAFGVQENSFPDNGDGNFSATVGGEVDQIRVVYQPGTELSETGQDQTIGLAPFTICAPVEPGSIGDTVYRDTNGDGTQNPGEEGIPGINLTLTSPGPDGEFGTPDDTTETTTTDENGIYGFPNVPAGNYRVSVTNPPEDLNPTQTPPETIVLEAGQNFDTADFGFTPQEVGSIGDTVYIDQNENNVQDEDETGIEGATVTLVSPGPDGQLGTNDDTTQTTTTNENGIYTFQNLPGGNYRVTPTVPEDFRPTQTQPDIIELEPGQNLDTVDFGFAPGVLGQGGGSIGDTVYNDTNRNNTQDDGETGIPGATVTLTDPGPDGEFGTPDDATQTEITNDNGNYTFQNLPAGNYRVITTTPDGLTPTQTPPDTVTLEENQILETVDFGFAPQQEGTGSIGDTVYNDTNRNNTQDDGETGIPGVTVTLTGPGPDGELGTPDDTTQTTTTDNNGIYGFTNLPAANYRVTTDTPDALTPTQTQPDTINLQEDQDIDTIDFGFAGPEGGTIGDTVFNDTDGNGVQDFTDSNNNGVKEPNEEGEDGIPGVQLTLRDSEGNTVATTTTNNNGNYIFNGLDLGNYTVESARPSDFSNTTETTLPAQLSEANPDTNEVDFGFQPGRLGASGTVNFRLVKRITLVLRGNQPISGVAFNQFEDDPNDNNDNELNSSPQSSPVGVTRLETPVQSGDIVQYTVYFRSEGGESLQNVKFCDLIPEGTTFVNGSINVNGGGDGADNGEFLSPLTPVPADFQNICRNATPANGAVLTNLGTLPAGGQFGFVRFRVRVN